VTSRLLILGGTAEAADLARAASAAFGEAVEVITSLAGRLTPSQVVPGRLRVGGFGGLAGLAAYLMDERIDAVVDATHPFAQTISQNAVVACDRAGVPRLRLERPSWRPGPGDRWLEVDDVREAAARLPQVAGRAFVTTGSGSLEAFGGLATVWLLVRLFEPPKQPLPLAGHEVVVARPPFTVGGERSLLRRHRIDTLVTKQSGGATEAKLTAAREAGIPVLMIRRPPPPPGDLVDGVADALVWLQGRV
jgi:precorrin-6A/cobalt-precorrin-6A reductase